MIQVVVFDAVGTLIHPDPPVAQAYASAGKLHGCAESADEVLRRFRAAFAAEEARDRQGGHNQTSEVREERRWRSIVGSVFPQARDGEALFQQLWGHFADPRHWRVFSDVASGWQALHRRGLRLAVASNFDSRLVGLCARLEPLSRAEHVFVSSQMGWRKPAGEFYAAVARVCEVAPEQLLMVGDSLELDCDGARAAGWQAVHLNRTGDADWEASLSSLSQLPQWLDEHPTC